MNKIKNICICSLPMCWHAIVFLFYFWITLLCSALLLEAHPSVITLWSWNRKSIWGRGVFREFLAGARDRRLAIWRVIHFQMMKCFPLLLHCKNCWLKPIHSSISEAESEMCINVTQPCGIVPDWNVMKGNEKLGFTPERNFTHTHTHTHTHTPVCMHNKAALKKKLPQISWTGFIW